MVLYDSEAQKEKMRPGVGLVTRNPGNGLRWGPPEEALGLKHENTAKAKAKASKPRVRVDVDDKRDRGGSSVGTPKTPNHRGATPGKTPKGSKTPGGSPPGSSKSTTRGKSPTPGKSPTGALFLSSSPLPEEEEEEVSKVDAATQTFDPERSTRRETGGLWRPALWTPAVPKAGEHEHDHEVSELVRSGNLERALELLNMRGDASAAWQRQRIKMLHTRSVEQSFATSHAWPIGGRTDNAASSRVARVATAAPDAAPFHPGAGLDPDQAASRLMREFATLSGLDDPRFRQLVNP